MARHLVIVRVEADRQKLIKWAAQCPWGTRVEWKAPVRTLPQNDHLHALVDEWRAKWAAHSGKALESRDVWKQRFLHALQGSRFIEGLDGNPIPFKPSTADLTREECADLIELVYAHAAQQGIELQNPRETYE